MDSFTLHIGLWKTGSTFLQKKVFLGETFGGMHISKKEEFDEVFQVFMNCSPLFWKTRDGVSLLKRMTNERKLWTSENFYRAKVFDNKINRGISGVEPYAFCNHLRLISEVLVSEFNKKLKVLFFFRKQPDWLASMYSEMSKNAKVVYCQEHFESVIRQMISKPYSLGDHVLDFSFLLDNLAEAVGNNNVLGLPYELLNNSNSWENIRDFTEISELANDVDLDARVNVKSSGNKSWSLWSKDKGVYVDGMLTLSAEIEHLIKGHYQDSNKAFSEKIKIDLGNLGYY